MLAIVASAKQCQSVAESVLAAYRLLAFRLMQMNASNMSRFAQCDLRAEAKPLAAILATPLGDRALLDTRLVRTRTSAWSTGSAGRRDSHVVHGRPLPAKNVSAHSGRETQRGPFAGPARASQQCGVDR